MPSQRIPPLDEIFGRDALTATLWQILEEKSVVFTAERRMGKTYVLYKLLGEAKQRQQDSVDGWETGGRYCIYHDISRCSTAMEFARSIVKEGSDLLGLSDKMYYGAKKRVEDFSEVTVSFLRLSKSSLTSWKDVISGFFESLDRKLSKDGDRAIFMWDEFPMMLDEIIRKEGCQVAGEVLNLLRTLREKHPNIRTILTGSIGLHHVLHKLRDNGYKNSVISDMKIVDIEPLEAKFAIDFSKHCLQSKSVKIALGEDLETIAVTIAEELNNIPFYIKELIDKVHYSDPEMTQAIVGNIVEECLFDVNDIWHMSHYLDRLDNYYGREFGEVARSILDLVADRVNLATSDIIQLVQNTNPSSSPIADKTIRDILELLQRDSYIKKDNQAGTLTGTYSFRYSLIRRYWRYKRG